MSIRPIDINGMIQRTQDVGNIKQQEAAKPLVDQQNIQGAMAKSEERISHQVTETEKSEQEEYRYDAKEKGGSSYKRNGGKKQKKDKRQDAGSVTIKGQPSGFDIKI